MADVLFTPNQPFRHDKTSYEADVEVPVDEKLAFYFQMNGWGSSPAFADEPGVPQPPEVTLEVADNSQGQAPEAVN